MPVYEYELIEGTCDQCPGRFEARQWMKDEPLKECPKCQKPVRRLISKVAVHKPQGVSDLKSAGMTRLVRRDKGIYEVEGADSGLLDLNKALAGYGDDPAEENVYDLSDYAPPDFGSDSPPEIQPKQAAGIEAPLKKRPDQPKLEVPYYDLTRSE